MPGDITIELMKAAVPRNLSLPLDSNWTLSDVYASEYSVLQKQGCRQEVNMRANFTSGVVAYLFNDPVQGSAHVQVVGFSYKGNYYFL